MALNTTALVIADGVLASGVLIFIRLTFICSGEDLFLFRILPPRGVFAGLVTGDITFTGERDFLAFDLADAGLDTMGD